MKIVALSFLAALFVSMNFSEREQSTVENNLAEHLYNLALEKSIREAKPILVLFTTEQCQNGKLMSEMMAESHEITLFLRDSTIFLEYVITNETVADYGEFEIEKFGTNRQPFLAITDQNEHILAQSFFLTAEDDLLHFLRSGVSKYYR